MDVNIKKQKQKWDGSGRKSVFVDYSVKEEKCEQEQNNKSIVYVYGKFY